MKKGKISLLDVMASVQDMRERAREAFFAAAQQGNVAAIGAYSRANAKYANGLQGDKKALLHRIIEAPGNYRNLVQVVGAITGQAFDFEKFFEADDAIEGKIWSMYARHSTPDVAHVAAELVAEYLRYRLLRDENYRVDLNRPLESWPQDGLSFAMKRQERRDGVVATQHALVNYVRDHGDALPLNRGGAFLKFMAGDYPGAAAIWTKPIDSLVEKDAYDIKRGPITRIDPVFAP